MTNIINLSEFETLKKALYHSTELVDISCILDSCMMQAPLESGNYEIVAGFGASRIFTGELKDLTNVMKDKPLLCSFSYELKNTIWPFLRSDLPVSIHWPEILVFEPEVFVTVKRTGENEFELHDWFGNGSRFLKYLDNYDNTALHLNGFEAVTSKEEYLRNVKGIREDISEGLYYELNYCQEFITKNREIDPVRLVLNQRQSAAAPFSAFFRKGDLSVICGSMERFFRVKKNKIRSQPIKGTNRRHNENEKQMRVLKESEKDRAENLMIVDLVRNDLAKVCKTGTVCVPELFGVYNYLNLNHMVSTADGELNEATGLNHLLQALFPMGSMTGAPKIEVLKNIEKRESTARGIYSGTIGYYLPDGNCDFNVVIRTLVYDRNSGMLSFHVGGAITYDSDPETEWEECMLKADGLFNLFRKPAQ